MHTCRCQIVLRSACTRTQHSTRTFIYCIIAYCDILSCRTRTQFQNVLLVSPRGGFGYMYQHTYLRTRWTSVFFHNSIILHNTVNTVLRHVQLRRLTNMCSFALTCLCMLHGTDRMHACMHACCIIHACTTIVSIFKRFTCACMHACTWVIEVDAGRLLPGKLVRVGLKSARSCMQE